MSKIFISYRRQDTKQIAGRIFERLENKFGKGKVFIDIDVIPFGVDFHDYLNEAVSQAEIVLVLIGKGWINAENDKGERRLDNPDDFVRIEIEAALKRNIPIGAVLIDNVDMPKANDLPESLQLLARRNSITLDTGRDFDTHIKRLITELDGHLSDSSSNEKTHVRNNINPSKSIRTLPSDYIDYLIELLKKERLFHNNSYIEVRFSYLDEALPKGPVSTQRENELLLLEVNYRSQVSNLSEHKQIYEPKLFIEKNWNWPKHKELVGINRWVVGNHSLSKKELREIADTDDDLYHIWYRFPHKIEILPYEKLSIHSNFNIVKHLRDTATWTFLKPCDGVIIDIFCPNNLETLITAKHPDHQDIRPSTTRIEIRKPMFPYTVIEVSWRKK